MNVKRYDCTPGVDGYMHEDDDGDYVRYEDCTDLRRAAEMLAVERGEFRIRAENAEAEIAMLRRDKARLDWVEANGCDNFVGPNTYHEGERRWFDTVTDGSNYSDTIRAAIDAAMREQGANTRVNPSHEVASG